MKEDWHHPSFAAHWDRTASIGNPSRTGQLDLVVYLLKNLLRPGAAVLDLGIGSGLAEERLLNRRPDLCVTGVDSSQAMLELAKQRLGAGYVRLVLHDLEEIDRLHLPESPFQAALCIQSLHHLTPEKQWEVVRFIHRHLEPDGLFLLMDRIELPPAPLHPVCGLMWEWLEQRADRPSGKTGEQFLAGLKGKGDHPLTLEHHLRLLGEAGFAACCLHLALNRAVLAGVKPAQGMA